MHSPVSKMTGFIVLMIVQIIFLVLFWVFVRYSNEALPKDVEVDEGAGLNEGHVSKYPPFQDIHVMIFIGFGFLMTFLRKYGYSATGYSLFLAALVVQWAILVKGFIMLDDDGKIHLSLENIIEADITAAVPLISMGALLGRTTPIQLLFMALFEVAIFAVNEFVSLNILSICDVGGSITVHAFGAYFGLAVALVLRPRKEENAAGAHEGPTYTSDLFAMVGSLFLWVYWPSFNSVLADGSGQERAILNTYLSLAAATVTTFVLSALVSHENKLDMVHVQNSTLAGGVAIGTICNLLIGPHGAILIGIIAGVVSVLGYRYLTPNLVKHCGIHDTCGVHNLHGMPAVLSALASAVYASLVTESTYKSEMTDIFPAMGNQSTTISIAVMGGYNRTPAQQAGYQLFGIAMTVLVAIASGLLAGIVLKYTCFRRLTKEEEHQDEQYWEVASSKQEYDGDDHDKGNRATPHKSLSEIVQLLARDEPISLYGRPVFLRPWNAVFPAARPQLGGP